MSIGITVLLIIGASVATALYFILGHRRPTADFIIDGEQLPTIDKGLCIIAGITNAHIHCDNSAELFENEAIFEAMLRDMRAARQSIHLETFVWSTGSLTRRFIDTMRRKVDEGVKVRVIVDAIGAIASDDDEFAAMREYGIELTHYRPIKRLDIRRFNNRTHRKLLVIDGSTGYVFGHGISDEWLGNAENKHNWRDTGVRLQGAVVQDLQSVFLQDWVQVTGHLPADPRYFPDPAPSGHVVAHVATSAPGAQSSVAHLYKLAMASARQEIIIQNPYFSPDLYVAELLAQRAQSGVAVHLMVPGKHTDAPMVRRAGCSLYLAMLHAGVRIYEYKPTLLHQKIVIVDGIWSHIGSTNFDERSLALNSEIGVGLLSENLAAQLKESFQRDLQVSRELQLPAWQQRPWYQRLIDRCAYLMHDQM